MKLTATLTSAAPALVLADPSGNKWGGSGTVIDVSFIASADTSVALVIADPTGNYFSEGSGDFTTRVTRKNDHASVLRNGTSGQHTATATGLGSGTLIVDVFIRPDQR